LISIENENIRVEARPRGRSELKVVVLMNVNGGWQTAAEIGPSAWTVRQDRSDIIIPHQEAEVEDGRLVLSGSRSGWCVSDVIAFEHGMIKVSREWCHDGGRERAGLDLRAAVRFTPGADLRIMLPGINYNNNSQAAPDRLVPRFAEDRPSLCLYEEHRFPVPMAHFEYGEPGARRFVSLLSVPSRIGPQAEDHWWSLGAEIHDTHIDMIVCSGMTASNGRTGVVYGRQNSLEVFEDTTVIVRPEVPVRKTFYLDIGTTPAKGYGFRSTLWKAYAIFAPRAEAKLSRAELVDLKLNAAKARYHEDGDTAGFLCLPEKNVYGRPAYFLCGWTGQMLRLAWAMLRLGRQRGNNALTSMGRKTVDFFARNAPLPSGLTNTRYTVAEKTWRGSESGGSKDVVSSRAFGETMNNLADCIAEAEESNIDTSEWRKVLVRAGEFLCRPQATGPDGLLPRFWTRDGSPPSPHRSGTAGINCISPLAKLHLLGEGRRFLDRARELLERYYRYNTHDLEIPYWGSTLDACCEDKEAAIGFLRAALDIYDASGDATFLRWAEFAADWALTFTYFWDPGFREGTICHGRMSAALWNSVSVQNQHVDVFAPCVELRRLGKALDNKRYVELGEGMLDALTQSVATDDFMWTYDDPDRHNVQGEQAEQFFQTNYVQGRMSDRSDWRGGINTWNPSWIIAHVLWQVLD